MKQLIYILIFYSIGAINYSYSQQSLAVTITAGSRPEKMAIALCQISHEPTLNFVTERIASNLANNQQHKSGFVPLCYAYTGIPSRKNIKEFSKQEISIAVLLKEAPPGIWQFWIYDTNSLHIVESKKIRCHKSPHQIADLLSDIIWEALTGQEGIFSTRIAFCKELRNKNNKSIKQLCVMAPQDTQALPIVKRERPLALRWHPNPAQELILYSSITQENLQLKAINLRGQQFKVSNFDGINLLPSFSNDGSTMVYCRSDQHGVRLFYCTQQPDGSTNYKPLLIPEGNNLSPIIVNNKDVIFCSDAHQRTPRIYYYHHDTHAVECLTPKSYATSPSWCAHTNQLAYCKLTGGTMQIYSLDLGTRQEKQLTKNLKDKDNCSWSPHGQYITYTHQRRIAIKNIITGEEWYVTPSEISCSYPAWSPRFIPEFEGHK